MWMGVLCYLYRSDSFEVYLILFYKKESSKWFVDNVVLVGWW